MGGHLYFSVLPHESLRLTRSPVFSKTLFTPAGIDIYLRRSSTSSVADAEEGNAVRSNLLGRIVAAVKASADKGVAKMAGEGFEVPGIV